MEFLTEYKWFFLVGTETSFWTCAIAFFLARYWYGLGRLSGALFVLIVAEEVVANLFVLGLAALDYRSSGEITTYGIVSVAVLAYALIFGRDDFKRLDAYLNRKVRRWKCPATPEPERPPTTASTSSRPVLDPEQWAREERRGWYKHAAVFVVGQAILLGLGASWPALFLSGELPLHALWTGRMPGENVSGLLVASRVWCVVLVVDTVWSFSYTLFPGRTQTR